MKTAEKILITSLQLFNQHGESNVSSVDIALELDISPGNLYYHFKGKEVIVAALFDLYREQANKILASAYRQSLTVDDFFYFLFLLLEKGHLFQFLLHNPADLADKYPGVAKGLRTQLISQEKSIERLLRRFAESGHIRADNGQILQVLELIGLVFTQAANYYFLKGQSLDNDTHVYKSLAMILFAVLPYMNMEKRELEDLQHSIVSHTLAGQLDLVE